MFLFELYICFFLSEFLAYSLVLLNTGNNMEAVKELNSLIKEHPNIYGAYNARGAAYTRQGVQVSTKKTVQICI